MAVDPGDALAFVTVVREGGFTAAARKMRVPKTTLSRRVRVLEAALGVRLLNRTTRRLALTEAGTIYFRHCDPLARGFADAEAAVGQLLGAPRGWLRITAPQSLVENLLSEVIADFLVLYPDIRVDLSLSHQPEDIVARGQDIALRMGPVSDTSLAARRLAVFPNRVYAAPAYLARWGQPEHPGDLISHRALATRVAVRGGGYAWPMRAGPTALADFPVDPVLVADDPEVLKAPLLAGLGLMMATDLIMRRLVAGGQVRPVLDGWVGRCPELHAIFPQGPVQPPKLRAFVDFLVARLGVRTLPILA